MASISTTNSHIGRAPSELTPADNRCQANISIQINHDLEDRVMLLEHRLCSEFVQRRPARPACIVAAGDRGRRLGGVDFESKDVGDGTAAKRAARRVENAVFASSALLERQAGFLSEFPHHGTHQSFAWLDEEGRHLQT